MAKIHFDRISLRVAGLGREGAAKLADGLGDAIARALAARPDLAGRAGQVRIGSLALQSVRSGAPAAVRSAIATRISNAVAGRVARGRR